MMKLKYFTLSVAALAAAQTDAYASRILHVPMDLQGRETIREAVGGKNLFLFSKTTPENIPGASGMALRLDGFSAYAQGNIDAGSASAASLTFSMWVAPETYPVIALDTPTEEKIRLAGTLDDSSRAGWQFSLGYTGKYAFECYSGGWKVTVEASDILPCYEWCHLVAVAEGASKTVTLYRNGQKVGEARCMDTFDNSASKLTIGRSVENSFAGPFMINTFNGLVDDVEVHDRAFSASEIAAFSPEHEADLSIPASRYADQTLRPRFHGMPATAWTNECHGMTYSNGRYHLFFQKNANGPYMTRLHWGHISSSDLVNWREERIAIAPGESYDIKGCWSGAIVSDDVLTGGKPAAIYTAVDYARATICMATPADDDLVRWNKSTSNPLINGRPSGLSDDFRDPYFFRSGDDAYIIVGTSKGGLGAVTLHKMDPASKRFTNDGRIFFSASHAASQGTFWEMPNITPMPGGKWLFTVTPLGTSQGVRCLYWVGTINADGTFRPESGPRTVEMNSKEGYGLLSPTVYTHDGRTIALGIVPDKISGENNYSLGWAHCYSLPREWSLDAAGNLVQKPFDGLKVMRSDVKASLSSLDLDGVRALDPVEGRHAEVLASFKVGTVPFGFRIFDNGSTAAKIYYNPATGELIADFTEIERWNNDAGSYAGIYRMALPERPAAGSDLKINLFVDGSILDIFVNDRWAQSIRVFPQSEAAVGISVYADGEVRLNSLEAWTFRPGNSPVVDILDDQSGNAFSLVDVYDISGRLVRSGVSRDLSTSGLDSGLYVIDGKKVMIR